MLNKNRLIALLGTVALGLTVTGCGNAQTTEIQQKPATIETAVNEVQTISAGNFSGRSDHVTTGQVSLERTANGYQLNFAADFFLDGAPDPVVAFGNGETFAVANKIGALKNRTGAQLYTLPSNFKPGQFSQVYVWCEQFSVPLGVADLT